MAETSASRKRAADRAAAALPAIKDFEGCINLDYERAVLGCALWWESARSVVTTELDADDFWDSWHRMAWAAIRAAEDANAPQGPLATAGFLSQAEREARGFARLLELEATSIIPESLPWFIAEVRQTSARRRAALLILDAASTLRNPDPGDLAAKIQAAIQAVDRGLPVRTIGEGLASTAIRIRDDVTRGQESGGILSPWQSLNRMTGGMMPGDLTILAARPSVGKSGTGLTWAMGTASAGFWTGFASQEMSEEQCHNRMLAQLTGIEADRIKQRALNADDLASIDHWAAETAAWPLHLIDKPALRVRDLYALAKTRCPRRASILFVDYLGLMVPEDKTLPTHKAIGSLTKGLKGVARALEIHVVALAQLHRLDKKNKSNPEPTMQDLRDSGEIEEDADNVILIHRHDYGNTQYKTFGPSPMTLILAKQRNGPTGRIDVLYDRATQRVWER